MSVLTIVLTILVIVLIIMFFVYYFQDPYTLQKLQNGQNSSTISASSLATNGSNVPSSNFAYSIWFYINDFNYRYGEPKVIFGRMGSPSATNSGSISGINGLDPCPAVVLDAVSNNLEISLGCFPGIDQTPTTPGGKTVVTTCSLTNIPIQKWVNLTISVYGRSLDVYIDGKLAKTCLLPGVANVNNNSDIYITPVGGFNGWTSRFQYYPNSLNPQDAYNIYTQGYSGNMFSNLLQGYQLQISLISNGTTQSSVTI
jgi:Concanavalin A-like lectin/glucanases superfamily